MSDLEMLEAVSDAIASQVQHKVAPQGMTAAEAIEHIRLRTAAALAENERRKQEALAAMRRDFSALYPSVYVCNNCGVRSNASVHCFTR